MSRVVVPWNPGSRTPRPRPGPAGSGRRAARGAAGSAGVDALTNDMVSKRLVKRQGAQACRDSTARSRSSPEPAAASGWASPSAWCDEGARVCLTARKPEALEEAVAALGGPDHAIAVAGKADDPEHRADAVRRTIETFGSLDFLVNNAGINPVAGPLIEIDLGAARKIVEVNALGALAWAQEAYGAWMAEHGGAIVNISSVVRREARAGHRDVRRLQGDDDQPHRVARRRARPGHPGQRRRARGREDPVRQPALRGPRGGGLPRVPAQAPRRARGRRRARSPSCSPTTPRGSPARRSPSTAA